MSAFFAAISDTGGGSALSAVQGRMSMPVLSPGGSHCCPLRTTPAQGGKARVSFPLLTGLLLVRIILFLLELQSRGRGIRRRRRRRRRGGGVREDQDTPSQHICPLVQELPFDAVHFDVPSANGTTKTPTSQQVYEKSALYQFAGTQGDLSLRRTLTHPFTRVRIARNLEWDCVRPVAPALQETLHREQLALGLLLEDGNPLNDNDRSQYDRTMRGCVARCIYFLCIL
jgi:hypothetical protein